MRAPEPPVLQPDQPPIAILVDYDGTIARTDVSDRLMAAFVTDEWEARIEEYDAGRSGSRRLMEGEVWLITAPEVELRALAAAQPHDPGFGPFVNRARDAGIPVEVVSDGFGFFIPSALATLGVTDVPVVTASTTFPVGTRPQIAFPNGHPSCFVCGTCKRARVQAHQSAGRAVVFIGDGESDRYAAGYADVVFAKDNLIPLCEQNGWAYQPWTDFGDIECWLEDAIRRWRVDPASEAVPRPRSRPFFCGPEVWGEGRWDPPKPAGYSPDAW